MTRTAAPAWCRRTLAPVEGAGDNAGMRSFARALAAVVLTGGALVGPLAAAGSAAGSGSATVPLAAEAWYRTAPVCTLPVGCPAQPPSPYPAETLHVGTALGAEESRTYLALDLTALPGGTKPAGGQLRLPVAGQGDGTVSPETAKLQACPVSSPVKDADGSFDEVPKADCEASSTPAVFVPGTATAPAAFTVDLGSLATAWQESGAPGALALLPAAGAAPTDTWHVAFSGRDRKGEGVALITAAVSYVSAAVDTAEQPPPPVFAPIDSSFTPGRAPSTGSGFTSAPSFPAAGPVPAPVAQPAPVAPAQVAAASTVAVASIIPAGFQYPAVFLLPLLLLGAAGWVGRALTRDLTPARV